jgi:hypothetical protein
MSPVIRPFVREAIRRYQPRLLYPTPASSLQPERLYRYLDALWQARELDGAVVEVGCWLGGTSAIACGMLERAGFPKRYVAVDTFAGFVPDQFEHDARRGTPDDLRTIYDANSIETVRSLLDHWGRPEVELLQADIATLDPARLPETISVGLIDVDLDEPVYHGLQRIAPRLAVGGLILVDDCPEQTDWVGARLGYSRFMQERGLPERYELGMGLFEATG